MAPREPLALVHGGCIVGVLVSHLQEPLYPAAAVLWTLKHRAPIFRGPHSCVEVVAVECYLYCKQAVDTIHNDIALSARYTAFQTTDCFSQGIAVACALQLMHAQHKRVAVSRQRVDLLHNIRYTCRLCMSNFCLAELAIAQQPVFRVPG